MSDSPGRPAASTATVTVAVDARSRSTSEAEHVVHRLDDVLGAVDDPTYVVSTHVVTAPTPHVVVVASWTTDPQRVADIRARLVQDLPDVCLLLDAGGEVAVVGPEELRDAAASAAEQHRTRGSGRLVRFRGRTDAAGSVSVAAVLERTCVDEVTGLAGLEPAASTILDLGDFFRPTWREGRCTLLVQATDGAPIPFEVRDQIACCSDH